MLAIISLINSYLLTNRTYISVLYSDSVESSMKKRIIKTLWLFRLWFVVRLNWICGFIYSLHWNLYELRTTQMSKFENISRYVDALNATLKNQWWTWNQLNKTMSPLHCIYANEYDQFTFKPFIYHFDFIVNADEIILQICIYKSLDRMDRWK